MRRFLNRILGLAVHRQNLLFNYFGALLQSTIRQAKAEGRFSEGMSDLPAAQISFACEPEVCCSADAQHVIEEQAQAFGTSDCNRRHCTIFPCV